MARSLLQLVVVAAVLAGTARGDDLSVVNVPSGVTTVMFDGRVELKVDTWVPARAPPMFVDLKLTDGNGTTLDQLVAPRTLTFMPAMNATASAKQKQKFTLFGSVPGRFYLDYALRGTDVDKFYKLGAEQSVVSIAAGRQEGWQGIWYQLLFNSLLFAGGMAFFSWQRVRHVELPIWRDHQEALFERGNYDDISPDVFAAKYGELQGATLKERVKRFCEIPCSGDYVSSTCGIPAALIMNFYRDCGHLFAILSFFSLAVMLPVVRVACRLACGLGMGSSLVIDAELRAWQRSRPERGRHVPSYDLQQRAAAQRLVLGPRGVLLPRGLRCAWPLEKAT
jgi:hypothetical protein